MDSLSLSSMMGLIWMTAACCALGIIVNIIERLRGSGDIKLPTSKLSYALCDGIRDAPVGFVDFLQNWTRKGRELGASPVVPGGESPGARRLQEARLEAAEVQGNGDYSLPAAEEPLETTAVYLSNDAGDRRSSGLNLPQGANLDMQMQRLGEHSMTLEAKEEKQDSLLASIIPASIMPWLNIGNSMEKGKCRGVKS
ncbi:hypothetical protein GUITHDRAFT_106511 [Guillardia theta CCMP2712]|uniref:Uncharacterized protein n=1 Tax=Guillardia theta (strain CCMP2712) TaxID=905079 RepID=L1JHA9_GUITC|nr:hypothetical protein GUITHDRAFT_106511 [Guillardia theta CCMP2712]EKX47524.1 hypothetical protein GUITHDRAFT_106511 [Guillardia theta CCMP2712]|eukprot:XP_005834504.1 hypothetical protein GUITHDRAFT_106511 [Guillardia theta CCMP2712]